MYWEMIARRGKRVAAARERVWEQKYVNEEAKKHQRSANRFLLQTGETLEERRKKYQAMEVAQASRQQACVALPSAIVKKEEDVRSFEGLQEYLETVRKDQEHSTSTAMRDKESLEGVRFKAVNVLKKTRTDAKAAGIRLAEEISRTHASPGEMHGAISCFSADKRFGVQEGVLKDLTREETQAAVEEGRKAAGKTRGEMLADINKTIDRLASGQRYTAGGHRVHAQKQAQGGNSSGSSEVGRGQGSRGGTPAWDAAIRDRAKHALAFEKGVFDAAVRLEVVQIRLRSATTKYHNMAEKVSRTREKECDVARLLREARNALGNLVEQRERTLAEGRAAEKEMADHEFWLNVAHRAHDSAKLLVAQANNAADNEQIELQRRQYEWEVENNRRNAALKRVGQLWWYPVRGAAR